MKKLILILFLATLSIYGQINGTGSGGKNYVSAVNSTVTALDSAATFTGGWELCWDYSYIQVVIKSNIGGTGKIQFSKSGTTATLLHQNTFTYTANDTLTNKVQVETAGNYYRVVYTNSTTDQTSFSLLTTMVARERLPLSNNQISITDTSSNTSLNDIESNSDAIKTSVEIMDDWDETNRAKVNLIVGEPGVSANRGSSDSTTQRVTIANNDSTVTLQKSIRDKIDTLEVTVNNIEDKVSTEAKQDTIINRVTATNLALAVTNDTLKTFKQVNHTDLSNIQAKQDSAEVSLNAIVSSLNDNLKGGTKYYGLTDTVTTRVDTTTFTDATKWIEGQLVADDSIEVAINGAFTAGETWIITVTTPVDLVRWDAVTSNKLYVRRYGSAGTPRFYIRVTSR